jgi:hypothetical protein
MQEGEGEMDTFAMEGQILQPPGPIRPTVTCAVQADIVFVTVTMYEPTERPEISSVVAPLLQRYV